jgi:hypothetical protein
MGWLMGIEFLSLLRNSTEEPSLFPCPFPDIAYSAKRLRTVGILHRPTQASNVSCGRLRFS